MSCGNFGNYEPSALRLYSENRLGLYSIIISVEMHILTSFLETYSMGYSKVLTTLTVKKSAMFLGHVLGFLSFFLHLHFP